MSIRRYSQIEIEALIQDERMKGSPVEDIIRKLYYELEIGKMFIWQALMSVFNMSRKEAMSIVVRATRI